MPSLINVSSVSALQQALNTIDVGGTIVVAPGLYTIPYNLANRVGTVFGITPFALRVMKPCTVSAYGALFKVDTAGLAYGALWAYQVNDFHLEGGRFIGSAPVTEGGQLSRPGILIHDCLRASLQDIQLTNFTQGVNVYESNDTQLTRVITEDTHMSGVMLYKSDGTELEGCRIKDGGDGHLSLYISSNTRVNNCLIQETRGTSGAQGITLEVERGSVIENCTVDGFYYGVDVKNDSSNCTVKDNTMRNNKYSAAIRLGDPLNPQNPCTNITITRNRAPVSQTFYQAANVGTGHLVANNYPL